MSLAVISCQKPLFESPSRSEQHGTGSTRDSTQVQPVEEEPPVPDLYATAFVFPDSTASSAELVLFKNGEKVLSLPVEGPPEADRHRLSQGQLWTDRCDGHEMVISCNGKERFRYEGDELLRGFLNVNGLIYTLGQRRGKGGFSFRINGKEQFSAPTGTVLGGPEDSDWEGGAFSQGSLGVYYTYGIPVWKGDGLLWQYRVMKEEETFKVIPPDSVNVLYDIRVHRDTVYRSELLSSYSSTFCLVRGDTYKTVEMAPGEKPHYLKLVPYGEKIVLKGYSTGISSSKGYSYWIRDNVKVHAMVTDSQPILELLTDGPHTAYLVEGPEHTVRTLYLDKENIPFSSDRFRLPSRRCAQYQKGILGVALSDPAKGEHLLIRDREVTTLHFNGCFTSLQIY